MTASREEPEQIGLAELRQHASDVVKQVEAGGEFIVTVSGRAAARLVGLGKRTWVPGEEAATLLSGLPAWGVRDRGDDSLDEEIRDPWGRRQ